MSKTRHQNFRSFLTERFTAAAVEIFEEVEHIVETYYEENKHLRRVLHMVLTPEMKIPRIDEALGRQTGATTNVRELSNQVDLQISEPLPKKLKEEQVDYDINNGSEQQCEEQQGLGETDLFMTPDCVKNDPEEEVEEDTNISCIADSFQVDVVEWSPDTSSTVSTDEANEERKNCLLLDSDGDPKSRSREGTIRKSRKKIDINVIGVMTDEELGQYIVRYGDRLALRAFCHQRTVTNEKSGGVETVKSALMQKVRDKLGEQRKTPASRDTEGPSMVGNKHAVKVTRRVEMGWLHFDNGTYHQIKTRNGGGTRHLSVQKSVTMGELLEMSKGLFFPNGHSTKGPVEDFEFDIRDYSRNAISPEVTVGQLYEQTQLRMLRIYTTSKALGSSRIVD
ncbi:uncharacterized protein [Pagrus major]|uniref:uncharacterized protein n=1 Tax=Pagrus major TaxID=143350 RepID=UPI003CC89F0A